MTDQISPFLATCQNCGIQADIEFFINNKAFAAVVTQSYQLMGRFGDVMLAYLRLFRPAKHNMTPKRAEAALNELVPMIVSGTFVRNGSTYTAPRDAWAAGMQAVFDNRGTIKPPLTSHAYLLTVMARQVDSARDADLAAQDKAHEQRHRSRQLNNTFGANP
jgi:hypothetical protein